MLVHVCSHSLVPSPIGMLVLCLGIRNNPQDQVNAGVVALAGTTIMLLTIPLLLAIYCVCVSLIQDARYRTTKLNYGCRQAKDKLLPASRFLWGSARQTQETAIKYSSKYMLLPSFFKWLKSFWACQAYPPKTLMVRGMAKRIHNYKHGSRDGQGSGWQVV